MPPGRETGLWEATAPLEPENASSSKNSSRTVEYLRLEGTRKDQRDQLSGERGFFLLGLITLRVKRVIHKVVTSAQVTEGRATRSEKKAGFGLNVRSLL